jgi:hypothetical protein
MNRKILLAGVLAAMPGILCAQEYKLVNCRTLEAAGNFVGSDEVLNGDMVCKKAKAGAAVPAEAAKPPHGAVISGSESMNVAEAAKANAKTAVPAKDSTAEESPAAVEPAVAPPPSSPHAEQVSAKPKPSISEAIPAAVPLPPATPGNATGAVSAALPGATGVSTATPSTPVAPKEPMHRDAPVAEGTPSAPPEKDYGFSDVNAVEPPKAAVASRAESIPPDTGSADQNAARNVRVGAFGKPAGEAVDVDSQARSTNFPPGDTDGFQEGQRAGCTKNVTFGSLRDDKLVLGTSAWAQRWIEKNQKRLATICFSATPMRGAQNYLMVFYRRVGSGEARNALPVPDASGGGDVGRFTTKYGSTWHYVVDRKVATTVLTKDAADEPQSAQPTAYAEDGTPVVERWPERGNSAKSENAERTSEELLSAMVEDLRKL